MIIIIIPLTLTLTSAVLPQNGPVKEIAALGDSYSSGEGNPPFDLGTVQPGDTCHRSAQAWPRLVGVDASYLLACSGATSANLSVGQMPDAPDNVGQLDRLRLLNAIAPIDDVTVTIGGNDLGFGTLLFTCVIQLCLRNLGATEAHAKSIANTFATQTYPAIEAAARSATVLVVGYPRLFPTNYASTHGCGWLTKRDLTDINQLQADFNSDLERAAQQARVTFVSTTNALSGHELCTKNPWLVPITFHCGPTSPTGSYCAHPTSSGQQAIAALVRAALTSPTPTPSPQPAQPTVPAQQRGGHGTVTTAGQVGNLRFGTSRQADIVAQAGSPDTTAQGSFEAPNDPDYQALGYGCMNSQVNPPARPLQSLTPQGSSQTAYCATIYYINVSTGTLAAFWTDSSAFATPRGTTPGTSATDAQSREQQTVAGECRSGISLGSQADPATVFLDVPNPAPVGPATTNDEVDDIAAESNQNPIGLLFC